MVTKTRSLREGVVLFMYLMLMGFKINGDDPCFGVCLCLIQLLVCAVLSSFAVVEASCVGSKSYQKSPRRQTMACSLQ